MKYIFVLIVALSLTSCASIKMETDSTLASPKIVMSKGACFGECPVYTLTVYNTGLTKFNGVRFTKMDGKYEMQLSEAKYIELVRMFEKTNLWKYEDVYDMTVADLPTTSISYSTKEKTKTVKGKAERPEAILSIENYLVALIENSEWTLLEAPVNQSEKEDKAQIIDDEIIIKGSPEMILVRWLKNYKQYGLRIGKRLGPDSEYWMVRFDKNLIEPAEMLKKIKEDPAVEEAEFNKIVKNRD